MVKFFKDTKNQTSFLIIFIFINLIFLNNLGHKDNQKILEEQIVISQALSSFDEGDFSKSSQILLEKAQGNYSDSYIVNLHLARSLKELEKKEEAKFYYKIAYNINPGLLQEEVFLEEIKEIEDSDFGY